MAETQRTFWTTTALFLTIILSTAALRAQAERLSRSDSRRLDDFVGNVMTCAKIPAVGVSLVSMGDLAYKRSRLGSFTMDDKKLEAEIRRKGVGEDTAFCLGGSTQAFTAVLLAKLLAAQKNYTMETPVHEIVGTHPYGLPGQFRRQMVNLKDILAMRTGLSNMDIIAIANAMNRYELLRNLQFAPEVSWFRERNVYSEVLFPLVEDAARALGGGKAWEELLRQHILEPLGMTGAVFLHENTSTLATPVLAVREGKHIPLSWDVYKGQEMVKAATSLCASATDMAKWMIFVLNGGKTQGNRRLMREETITSTFKPVQARSNGGNPRTSGFQHTSSVHLPYSRESNALGWIRGQYRGSTFVAQEGSLPGYESLTTLIPSREIGVFTAFTGVAGGLAYAAKVAINDFALDLLLHGGQSIEKEKVCETMKKMAKLTDDADERAMSPHPRPGFLGKGVEWPLADYEGVYRSYAYGDVTVSLNESGSEKQLVLTYGEIGIYDLLPSTQNDTFIMRARGPLYYSTNAEGYLGFGEYLAIFGTPDDDPSLPVETVLIPRFAKDSDPLFSKRPVDTRRAYDCHCHAAMPPAASLGLVLALAALLRGLW